MKVVLHFSSLTLCAAVAMLHLFPSTCQAAQREPALKDRIYLGSRASVSKDGSFFVFEWADAIWKASTRGGEAEALLSDDFENAHPILSPDDREIAFVSNRDGGYKNSRLRLEAAAFFSVSWRELRRGRRRRSGPEGSRGRGRECCSLRSGWPWRRPGF